jgi:outer membrane lipoprotein-sorting protein
VKNKGYFVLALIMFVAFIAGCVPSKPVYEEKTASFERLIRKIEVNKRRIKTFYGIGSLGVFSKEENLNGNFEVYIKRPDSLKIVIYGPFGIDLAQVLLTKDNFKFYDVMNNTLHTGKLNNDVLKKIIKMNISFSELYESLTGAMSFSDRLSTVPAILNNSDGTLELTYIDSTANRKNIYKVNSADLTVNSYKVTNMQNKEILTGAYQNYKSYDEIAIPRNTVLEYKENKQKLTIEYRTIEVNKVLDNIDFSVPDDVKLIKW